MIKLIAIDMDGTLLKKDHTISDKNKKAIQKAREKGVKVVICSGRPHDGLEPYLKELDMTTSEDYVIGFNGAIVKNAKTGEVISETFIKGTDLKRIYKISQEMGINTHAFTLEGCITPRLSTYTNIETTINQIDIKVIDFNEIDDEETIIKTMLIDPPEMIEKAMQKLTQEIYEDYSVVRSAPYFLEFLHKKANKGEGVKALADHLGINREEIMTIGDAGNDFAMIEYAGMGVAMGNAFDEIKAIANFITKTNEEDGVAYAIEKFVLNEEKNV